MTATASFHMASSFPCSGGSAHELHIKMSICYDVLVCPRLTRHRDHSILSRRPRLHGYAIMTAIQDMSGDVLRAEEGSIYPALHRMEEAGWVRAQWVTKDTGRRARLYELTAAGRGQLAAEQSRWLAVTSAVNRVLRIA